MKSNAPTNLLLKLGKGPQSLSKIAKFSELVKFLRKKVLKVTLREFCSKHNLDPGNWSRLENGRVKPPKDIRKLQLYAGYLEIEQGSDLWKRFFDLSCAENGKIPPDIMSDDEIIKLLLNVFDLLRKRKIPKKGMTIKY